MSARRGVRLRVGPAAASPPCDSPPAAAGRLRRAAHPLVGILFVYVVAVALIWGAAAGGAMPAGASVPGDALLRLAVAYLGNCLLVVAAVHWIEGVQPGHLAAKLGWSPARARWWASALLAGLPAWILWARALHAGADAAFGSSAVTQVWRATVAVAAIGWGALWREGFCRGFAFRGLMRRHGFALSAATSAALLALAIVLEGLAGSPLQQGSWRTAALLELPLSLALCQLFWMPGQSLGPALLVRIPLLGASLHARSSWPMGAAAVLLLLCGRLLYPRWSQRGPSA